MNQMAKVAATDPPNDKLPGSKTVKQIGFDKWFNILLCRSDLNSESLDNQPVSFTELVNTSETCL